MKITDATEYAIKPIDWLWNNRIPKGQITIIEGDPGCGKSQLTCMLAAHITKGMPWPDGEACEAGVVMMANAEDPEEAVIIPRLIAAGADISNVKILSASDTGEFVIPDSVEPLHKWIESKGVEVKLVTLDPFEAFLSNAVDAYRNHHIRRGLRTLERMAKDLRCSIIIVRHLTKDSQRAAIYRGTGSIGVIGAARAGFNVAKDPSDAHRSILTPVKGNWSEPKPAIAFRIENVELASKEGELIRVSRINWDGEIDVKADDLGFQDPNLTPGEISDAIQFLAGELADGFREVRDVFSAGAKVGISKKALYRAARVTGVIKRKEGFGNEGKWIWEMPASVSFGNINGIDGMRDIYERTDDGTRDWDTGSESEER